MNYKENITMGNKMSADRVKPEPKDDTIPFHFSNENAHTGLKQDPGAVLEFLERGLPIPQYMQQQTTKPADAAPQQNMKLESLTTSVSNTKPVFYTVFDSAEDIFYSPEEALKEGIKMVKTIKTNLEALQLGKLRKEVWSREIENLENQGSPTTLIAVCGATGAGKSSILNAILDDNVVPTSGMRACTAVVTELAYHNKPTIEADVSFLSETEWREELGVLLHDLVDEDGNIKRSTDLKSDAGVAWSKVHAVYPDLSQEHLVKMTLDQIIAHDPQILRILGKTKKIVSKDSRTFAKEISKYIDSKDQKRGDKAKNKEKSLIDKAREATSSSASKNKPKKEGQDAPALWPLIRQVNVRCQAAALSTGAVLVDLPGVADANAARNNIAKDYMKKCDCIWILAPITRAVDDKTARDLLGDAFKMQLMNGNYDDHSITFIASKCDDISCSEVVRALNLYDDLELQEIEERLEQYSEETSHWKKKKSAADKLAKGIEMELKDVRKRIEEHEAHLEALENGESFVPKITATSKNPAKASMKRKNSRKGKGGSSKRRRSGLSSEDDFNSSDGSIDVDSDGDSDSDSEEESDDVSDDMSSSGSEASEDELMDDEPATTESLGQKIQELKSVITETRKRLNDARKEKKEAIDHLSTLTKNSAKAQKEKNAFCSLKRSEFSREVLKEDFRTGLKDLDDAAAEERDPNGFNPSVNLRDYDAIDLPVFTCSSRDYVRLKAQVKGDGESTCFSNVDDTGIPGLQRWCHQLTVSSRERAAKNFLSHLKTFAISVESYVQGAGDVTVQDREILRQKWESNGLEQNEEALYRYGSYDLSHSPGYGIDSDDDDDVYDHHKPASKVEANGNLIGVTPRLCSEFSEIVDQNVQDLQQLFKDGLEDKCRIGAANAAAAAVATTEEFGGSMHWATYRATLRRHGSWRRDLNVELVTPFTRVIAHSWSKVFESDLFAPFEASTINSIRRLLKDVEDSAAPGLKDRCRIQADLCLEDARVALRECMDAVKETMNTEQKEVSRCMAPHVQAQLVEGYDRAMEERGTGSVARQKAYFRSFVSQYKDEIFDDGAVVMLERLRNAAEAIGGTLDDSLGKLAQKIEVNLSVLWEGTRDDATQMQARRNVVEAVSNIKQQIMFWNQARESKHKAVEDEDIVMKILVSS